MLPATTRPTTRPTTWRLVVEGEVDPGWAGWFGGDAVVLETADGRTTLLVVVPD